MLIINITVVISAIITLIWDAGKYALLSHLRDGNRPSKAATHHSESFQKLAVDCLSIQPQLQLWDVCASVMIRTVRET